MPSLWSRPVLFAGIIVLLAHQTLGAPAALEKRESLCATAPIMPNPPAYGAPLHAGDLYCDTAWDKGLVITGMEVWSLEYQIKGIQFHYSDGKIIPPLKCARSV